MPGVHVYTRVAECRSMRAGHKWLGGRATLPAQVDVGGSAARTTKPAPTGLYTEAS